MNRMKNLRSIMLGIAAVVVVFLNPASVLAADGLKAVVNGDDPLKTTLKLTNETGKECQVVRSATGTVSVTRAAQDGKTITPEALETTFSESPEIMLDARLKTLKPGESVDIPLRIHPHDKGHSLETVTWSADAGSMGQLFKIEAGKPLQLDLVYSIPITPADGPPLCAAEVRASSFTTGGSLPWKPGAGVLFVLALALIIWRLIKKRRHSSVAAAVIIAGSLGLFWYSAPQARAFFEVPEAARAQFNECMATLEANRDITGPVLDAANDPSNRIEIVIVSDAGSETARYGSDYYRIYWDSTDTHPHWGTGGNADPCTSLYHELYHVLDYERGTFSRTPCGSSRLETKEVMATRAQNVLRARLGMPERSHYGREPLPAGDCTAPPPPARSCTGPRCGDSNGDPHLRTFDGLRYDFQAVGEFILARSKPGDFEVQVRQEPWPGYRTVSVNTAVVMKVGGDRVEVRAGQKEMVLLVNGSKKPLQNLTLPKGGELAADKANIAVAWADGSQVILRPVSLYGLHVVISPSDELSGKLEGLLGDADGTNDNDLVVRGSGKKIKPVFKELYPAFADSWRIDGKASLFLYESGKNTDSYTDRSFPDKDVKPAALPGYAAAEKFCRSLGVTDPGILANCALDVALTGRPEFARAAVNSQAVTEGADFGGQAWQLTIKNPGEDAQVTFDAQAGEKVYIYMPKTTLPNRCGNPILSGPSGKEISRGCIINGIGQIDGTVLQDAGTHTIKVVSDGAVGTADLRLLRIKDKQGTIQPDGQEVTTNIDKPGVIARYTFTGKAGQRVFLNVPKTTLPNQCGPLSILSAAGQTLGSGCIINGRGHVDTVVLPADGQYVVQVNPSDRGVGQMRLRLTEAEAKTQKLSIGGPAATINLTKAGSAAHFTFNGSAGQRVYVDIPKSSIPNQCGGVYLEGSGGQRVGSGCIINGKGDINKDGIVLPASGEYKVTVDPSEASTGDVTVKVR